MKIDIYHDTVCPWCRIGKRNLELALADWDGEPADISYHTFFLNDGVPAEGVEFRPFMQSKGRGQIPLEQFFAAPRERGSEVGLEFNFEDIEIAPNSALSHRLIALAPDDKKEAIIDAVYAAYFQFGRNIGDLEVLLDIAAEQGLDVEVMRKQLEGDGGLAQVTTDVAFARQNGISGVPFFIIDERYAFSGAQPPHLITQLLDQVAAEQAEAAV